MAAVKRTLDENHLKEAVSGVARCALIDLWTLKFRRLFFCPGRYLRYYCQTEEKSGEKCAMCSNDKSVQLSAHFSAHFCTLLAMREAPVCGRLEGALAPS